LNLAALDVLDRAGLADSVRDLGGHSIKRFELLVDHKKLDLPLPGGMSVSRAKLDALLVRAARDAGVEFLSGARAEVGACRGESRTVTLSQDTEDATLDARVVILASGLAGTKMPEADLSHIVRRRSRIGAGCVAKGVDPSFASGTIHMAHGKDGYVGVVRVEEEQLNFAAALDPEFVRRCGGVATAAMRIMEAAGLPYPTDLAEQAWKGTPLLTRRIRRVSAPRLLAVGDASGYVEPFTGEGMAWALAAGMGVGQIIREVHSRWDERMEREWAREYRRLIRARQAFCRVITWGLRQGLAFRLSLRLLRRSPALAQPLIQHLNHPFG
jgi:flavin-dependent dehydrogenase